VSSPAAGGSRALDCLAVFLCRDYGESSLDFAHEYVNLFTGLTEHPRLRVRAFHPDLEAARHGPQGMRARFEDIVRRDPPELLIHHAFTPEMDPPLEAIAELTRRGVPTVEWDADSSWRFDDFIRPRLGVYTLFVTTHAPAVARYEAAGGRVLLTGWGVGSWYAGYPPESPRDLRLSFVGQRYGNRKRLIQQLRRRGLGVHVAGRGWKRRPQWPGRGKNLGYVSWREALGLIGRSRISLNLSNASASAAGSQIKGRHWEIPALGACQVSTPTEGLERWFEPGKEVLIAPSEEALSETLREALADEEGTRRIAAAGYRRTWAEHTWAHRIDEILRALGL
jgi:spore maturation protein CgeB